MKTLQNLHLVTGTKNILTNTFILLLVWFTVTVLVLTLAMILKHGIKPF